MKNAPFERKLQRRVGWLAAVLFVSANLLADIIYRWLDPRVEL